MHGKSIESGRFIITGVINLYVFESCYSDGACDGPTGLATHFFNINDINSCDLKPGCQGLSSMRFKLPISS